MQVGRPGAMAKHRGRCKSCNQDREFGGPGFGTSDGRVPGISMASGAHQIPLYHYNGGVIALTEWHPPPPKASSYV